MSTVTFLQIKELLNKHKVQYSHVTHNDVTKSSFEAAKIRGTRIEDAAKAIILKAELKDKTIKFIQAVVPGDKKIDLKKLRNLLNVKNVSLASPDEVFEKTGCTIGSVPPFGNLFDIDMFLDESILQKEKIVFSAGTHTDSIIISPKDYFNVTNPTLVNILKENIN